MSFYPEKLLGCWHPVAYAHDVKAAEPYGTTLLDEALVIWRSSDGRRTPCETYASTEGLRSPWVGSLTMHCVPVSCLALRPDRGMRTHTAIETHDNPNQSQNTSVQVSRTLRTRLGVPG